jgi:hypothetical protein
MRNILLGNLNEKYHLGDLRIEGRPFFLLWWGETEPNCYVGPLIGLLYQPQMSVEQLVEGEMSGDTEVLGENLPPMPLCPPQIPHDLTWARTRAAAMVVGD